MNPAYRNSTKLCIAVEPASAMGPRRLLFSALERVFNVSFVDGGAAADEPCAAHIFIGSPVAGPQGQLGAVRALRFAPDDARADRPVGDVAFGDAPSLDGRLRGRRLSEQAASLYGIEIDGGVVIASDSRSRPLWTRKVTENADIDEVAVPAPILRRGEALRDLIVPKRWLSLLPLVHFIREVSRTRGFSGWAPPPLRASFVIDDPNLHWRSYGAVDYEVLARHAADVGYHIAMATIPLDGWFVHPTAAELFRRHADYLSLTVHGNNHTSAELMKPRPRDESIEMLAQALQRARRLEARIGAPVSRVMVPPHEACSDETLRLLMRLGYDGATMNRPHPWKTLEEQTSPYATNPEDVENGWFPAVMRDDGFPVLIRRNLAEIEDAVLRAYLDQPLIFYGHIGDLSSGLDPLERVAREINASADVRWCSLGQISASNFEQRRVSEDTLSIRPFARRIRLDALDGVKEVSIAWEAADDGVVRAECVRNDGSTNAWEQPAAQLVETAEDASRLELTLVPRDVLDSDGIRPPRLKLTALARRMLTETADRAAPFIPSRRA